MLLCRTVALTLVILVAVALTGCRSSSGKVLKPLSAGSSVYIEPIADANNKEDETHHGSGELAQASLREQLLTRGWPVTTDRDRAQYVIVGQFTQWEDRATEWSAVPDLVAMSFTIQEIGSGDIIAHASARAKGSKYAFANDKPQRLIPFAVRDSLDHLLGKLPQ